jgi:AraC family transcriptional regulator
MGCADGARLLLWRHGGVGVTATDVPASIDARLERTSERTTPRHKHAFHQISVTLCSNQEVMYWSEDIGSTTFRPRHKGVFINPAHRLHAASFSGEMDRFVIDLNCAVVDRAVEELGLTAAALPSAHNDVDEVVVGLALSLRRNLHKDVLACTLYADSMAHFLAVHLLMREARRPAAELESARPLSRRQMRVLDNYVSVNLATAVGLPELAALLSMGQNQLLRRLKMSTGMTPHHYVMRKRIERARTMLRENERSIAEVALEVGFSSQSHFSERFRALVGTTPGLYRRSG